MRDKGHRVLLAQRCVRNVLAQVPDGHTASYAGKGRVCIPAPAAEAEVCGDGLFLFHSGVIVLVDAKVEK